MLFSIITVTLNNLSGLRQTHRTLASQTCRDFEWVVIDGGSDDGTAAFLKKDTNALWVSEPDHGIYDAMNKGLAHSSGDYALFLNAGDALAGPGVLEHLETLINEKRPDFIYGDAFEEEGGRRHYKKARAQRKIMYGLPTHHQAMLYRREAVGVLHYDLTYPIAADYKFTLEFLHRTKTVSYAPFPICLYQSGGLSQQKPEQGRAEQQQIRSETGLVTPLKNRLIALQQQFFWTLRQRFPNVYWLLRGGRYDEQKD